MGGFLAMPEGRIPVFGDMQLFRRKPFLLPSLAAAVTYVVYSREATDALGLSLLSLWLYVGSPR
jgi:hypothetical protein